jgi:hypothetical protein
MSPPLALLVIVFALKRFAWHSADCHYHPTHIGSDNPSTKPSFVLPTHKAKHKRPILSVYSLGVGLMIIE